MFIREKELSRKLEEKTHELLHVLEEKKDALLKELSGVDKATLTKLRSIMDDYYNAENQLSAYVQNYKKELTVAQGTISHEFEKMKSDIETETAKAETAFTADLSKIRSDFEKQLVAYCESYLMEDYTREVINRIAEESQPFEVVHEMGDSTTQVMSQKASSETFPHLADMKGKAFSIVDDNGNTLFGIDRNGHIQTVSFNSEDVKNVVSAQDVAHNFAFDITDENENTIFRIKQNGHIQTRSFDSENINEYPEENSATEDIDLMRSDFGKEMPLNIDYYIESDVIICKCKVSNLAGSILKLFTAVGSGVARGSASYVNFETGDIGFYGGISSVNSGLSVKYSKKVNFEFINGHEYVIEMMKRGKAHTIKITDAYTLSSDYLEIMPTGSSDIGEHWGKRSYSIGGNVEVIDFKNYSLQPYECRLLIIGDSFIEGATGFENHANRYCARMKRLLNGSCAINGFGGATTEQVKAFYESYCKTLFKADYTLIACGTNNTDFNSWLSAQTALITSIKETGSIPVLVTITRRLDSDNLSFIRQANNWIRNESNELYIDINRITTLNFDGETQNTALFAVDKVHPLPLTHELITKRALLDIPEVFNISSRYIKKSNNIGGKI